MMKYQTVSTPAGPLTLVVSEAGAVRAAGFTTEVDMLLALIHPSLHDVVTPVDDVGPAAASVRSYFDGDLTAIDAIEVEQFSKGEFIQHSWKVMREIKPGSPVTYSEFAHLAGRPLAVRAAASACASNPVAFFTPCHRVLRRDGSLGGYRWGLAVKRLLLDFESGE